MKRKTADSSGAEKAVVGVKAGEGVGVGAKKIGERPARRQGSGAKKGFGPSLAGGTKKADDYNIWYHKTPGRRESTKGM
jgi:hypothetical protein